MTHDEHVSRMMCADTTAGWDGRPDGPDADDLGLLVCADCGAWYAPGATCENGCEASTPTQPRDKATGMYAHAIDAQCVCGHPLGEHTGDRVKGQQPCLAYPCECERFRKARTR